jgi:histidine triad (HIT) family protein
VQKRQDSCAFCVLMRDLSSAQVVASSETCVAVLDVSPASLGHTLVMPRAHYESVWDLDDATAAAVMQTVRSVAALLHDRLAPDGLTVRQNNGAASGQRVPHVHVHLVPRWNDDGHIGWPRERDEPVDNAVVMRALVGQSLTRDEALSMRGSRSIDEPPADVPPDVA